MKKPTLLTRLVSYTIVLVIALVLGGMAVVLQSKNIIYHHTLQTAKNKPTAVTSPFPVSVNTQTKKITNDPSFNSFYESTFAQQNTPKNKLLHKFAALLFKKNWYQNLASPVSRIVVIWPGQRKEEVVKNIGDILRWDTQQRLEFQKLIEEQTPSLPEGKYYPGEYVTHRLASPADVAALISDKFKQEVLEHYTPTVSEQVPLADALTIASLLEREASDFENQRQVAGVIWNRLFIDMPLQLDATLQYAKSNQTVTSKWWPAVRPADKYIDSKFNSYQHKGLPPNPIANPSAEAVLAALNPIATDCLYYFHGPKADYYCSANYQQHVQKLKEVYGKGK